MSIITFYSSEVTAYKTCMSKHLVRFTAICDMAGFDFEDKSYQTQRMV